MSDTMKTIASLLKLETRMTVVVLACFDAVCRMQLRAKICGAIGSNAGRFQRNDASAIIGN